MPLKTQQDEAVWPNLTPMIDVVFQLLIFFMVGAKFTEMERQIEVRVPEVSQAQALAPVPEKRVIAIAQDGAVALDGRALTLPELTAALQDARREYEDLGVVVRGDADGRVQRLAEVLAACRAAGVRDIGMAVRAAPQAN